jgi:uncharacterized protein YecT (DUF1311 family)
MRTRIAIFLVLVGTPLSYGASFDCAKSSILVEKLICSNAELSRLDELLSVAYAQSYAISKNKTELKASQRRWLIEKRNTCADSQCIKNAYEARLYEIELGHDISGCYSRKKHIAYWSDSERIFAEVSDAFDLIKLQNNEYQFFLYYVRDNYNSCYANGIVKSEVGNGEIHLTMIDQSDDDAKNDLEKCQLKIVFSNEEFTFNTNQARCESYYSSIRCGYNANLNDARFSEANKVSNENYSTCEEATQDPQDPSPRKAQ